MIVRPLLVAGLLLLVAQTTPLALLQSTSTAWAQDQGTPTSDQPAPDALSGPLFNGQAPSECGLVAFDAMQDPNARWVYTCSYPNGDIATWRSDTDWTLLIGDQAYTPEGHAYLDGPEPGAPNAAESAVLALKGFPGDVLLLPLDQSPYANWPFQGIRVNSGPSYIEYAGDPIQRIGSDVLSIEASLGQPGYDPRSDFKPACQAATPYCYFPPFGQSSGAEVFNGLKARGDDAFVLHKTFPNEGWSLWWFDKTSNTSYTLTFGGDDVVTMFEPLGTFNKNNVTAAQKLAAMADKLIPWSAT